MTTRIDGDPLTAALAEPEPWWRRVGGLSVDRMLWGFALAGALVVAYARGYDAGAEDTRGSLACEAPAVTIKSGRVP